MRYLRGHLIAAGLFAGFFALHVVGGATGQGWLFALAVAGIFLSATGFGAIAARTADVPATSRAGIGMLATGSVAGVILTSSALWAANGRAWAAWEAPAAVALVALGTAAVEAVVFTAGRARRQGRAEGRRREAAS
jgi:hypothetical protein